MRDRVGDRWRELKTGLWFFPGLIAGVLALLALTLIRVDRVFDTGTTEVLFGGDASAARTVLSSVATSLVTVAGVTFSITIVVLQLASTQFTPRVLRNFLADRITQLTAGTFVGLFLYCLLVLRVVRDDGEGRAGFVPSLAITVAIGLSVLALGLLLVFINNIAKLVQVSSIASRIGASLAKAIDEHTSRGEGDEKVGAAELVERRRAAGEPELVFPGRSGYLQTVNLDQAVRELPSGDWLVEARSLPGDFVTRHTPLAAVYGDGAGVDGVEEAVQAAFNVQDQRDVEQDPAFAVRQLADIAIKALSPGVNDPTTAATCVDYLRAGLSELARRERPSEVHRFHGGRTTFVLRDRTLGEYCGPLLEVGRHAVRDERVAKAVLAAVAEIVEHAAPSRGEEADDLRARALELADLTIEASDLPSERRELDELRRRLRRAPARVAGVR